MLRSSVWVSGDLPCGGLLQFSMLRSSVSCSGLEISFTGCPRRETPWSVCMFLTDCIVPEPAPCPVFAALSYL